MAVWGGGGDWGGDDWGGGVGNKGGMGSVGRAGGVSVRDVSLSCGVIFVCSCFRALANSVTGYDGEHANNVKIPLPCPL